MPMLTSRPHTRSSRLMAGFAAACLLFASNIPTASAASSVVVLAQNYLADQREAIEDMLAQLLMQQKPGDQLTVLSARGGTRIAAIAIPDKPAYQHDRHRLPLLRPAFAAIRAAMEAAVAAGAPRDGSAPGQIGLPSLIENLRYHVHNGQLRVMLVGTPIHDDRVRSPIFSMAAAIPTGNHFFRPLSQTPFGLAGREGALPAQIHWCDTETSYLNPHHQSAVRDFWSGYLAHLGGRLMTLTPDLPMCLSRFAASVTEHASVSPAIPPDAPFGMEPIPMVLTLPINTLQANQTALLAQMQLPEPQAKALAAQIRVGAVNLIEIDAYDADQQDGDIAGVTTSSGALMRIPLLRQPTRVVVPIEGNSISIVGLVDGGGGGVTLGVRLPSASSSTADIHTPRLGVGQTVRIPVRLQ
ncbi:hypothetical protein [Teichococcus aestuarii]|nr:hypothetical protein [Pseudoroseomonas aestuarii]